MNVYPCRRIKWRLNYLKMSDRRFLLPAAWCCLQVNCGGALGEMLCILSSAPPPDPTFDPAPKAAPWVKGLLSAGALSIKSSRVFALFVAAVICPVLNQGGGGGGGSEPRFWTEWLLLGAPDPLNAPAPCSPPGATPPVTCSEAPFSTAPLPSRAPSVGRGRTGGVGGFFVCAFSKTG